MGQNSPDGGRERAEALRPSMPVLRAEERRSMWLEQEASAGEDSERTKGGGGSGQAAEASSAPVEGALTF